MNWIIYQEYMRIISAVWFLIEPVLEEYSKPERDPFRVYTRRPGGGLKHGNLRLYLNTIIYILLNGGQWCSVEADPEKGIVSGKTANKWHLKWSRNGLFAELTRIISMFYHVSYGYIIKTSACDCFLCKSPLGLEDIGPNPCDKGKNGSKQSNIVDSEGVPFGFCHAGANRHDSQLFEETLKNIFYQPILDAVEKNLYVDGAYIGDKCKKIAEKYGFTLHVTPRGKEKNLLKNDPAFKAVRWVVERTNSWFKLFRKLHTRYEKFAESYDGLTYVGSILMILRTIFRKKELISPWLSKKGIKKPTPEMYIEIGNKLKSKLPLLHEKYYNA